MSEISMITELVHTSPSIMVLAFILWFARTKMRDYDEHIKTCNQIPKQRIVEKLDDFCERMDGMHAKIVKLGERQEEISGQVNILVGRQMERDRA